MKMEETNKNINNEHDNTYKSFLKNKQTFLELLKGFVKEEWVKEVDEEELELIDKSFIPIDYKRSRYNIY